MSLSFEPAAAAAPPPAPGAHDVVQLDAATDQFLGREILYRDLLNALPAAIYTTDAQGRITFYNEAAVAFAGRRPELGDQWCVTWKLFELDGTPLPHDQCPMALALKTGQAVRGAEAIAERPDGSRVTFQPYPTPLFDAEGRLAGAVNMLVDITEQKAAEEVQRLLSHEVNHRANNLLSVVQSMVRLTRGDEVAEYRESLEGRLAALARAHNLLAKSRWMGADLQHLVAEEMAPYMGGEPRVWLSGSITPMRPEAAQALALIVHELATNAAKYGALSGDAGRVMVEWRREGAGKDGGELVLRWREKDGPRTRPPARTGVGTSVIARAAAQLGGTVSYAWGPGLTFELRAPADQIVLREE